MLATKANSWCSLGTDPFPGVDVKAGTNQAGRQGKDAGGPEEGGDGGSEAISHNSAATPKSIPKEENEGGK